MELAAVEAELAAEGLAVLGGLHPVAEDGAPEGTRTLVLVGPRLPGFWDRFAASPEHRDGAADPLDRWTVRVLGRVAAAMGASAVFPFGGPPWHPFIAWAKRTGRMWSSPVGLLVHDRLGLQVSFRGALAFREALELPGPAVRPCEGCPAPCLTACPAEALTGSGYDVVACRGWIGSAAGADCLGLGCAVRRACPVGGDLVPPAQAAFHMAAFRSGRTE